MDVNLDLVETPPVNGTVEIKEIPRKDWAPTRADHLIDRKLLYTWRPPDQLLAALPGWYDLSLLCTVDMDGRRRFSPVGMELAESPGASEGLRHVANTGGLVFVASVGGHALLADRGEIEPEPLLTLHEARLFNQYVRHLREYLGRTRRLGRVLHVCAGGKEDRGTANILPADLGLDHEGNGTPWSPAKLKEEGLRGALAAGHENPTPDVILRFGLLAAARRNPLAFQDEETNGLVHLAMFGLGPTVEWIDPIDLEEANDETRRTAVEEARKEAVAYVAEQVKASLKDHLDDTTEEFNCWIEDAQSNLPHRISKRKDCTLNRKQVTSALLQLGWQSFEMLGRCVDAQMRAFRESLPDPLIEFENALFEQVYLAHPALGGFPLLLLHDRLDFLKEAILETWDCPGERRAMAVVHTMMYYYSVLASNRRATDRIYKQRAHHRTSGGRVSRDEGPCNDVVVPQGPSELGIFKEAARCLAIARGFDCDFGETQWDARLIVEPDADPIVFYILCPAREFDETIYVPREEFESAVREVAEERE